MNMRFQMGMSKNQQIDPRLEIINVSCQLNRIQNKQEDGIFFLHVGICLVYLTNTGRFILILNKTSGIHMEYMSIHSFILFHECVCNVSRCFKLLFLYFIFMITPSQNYKPDHTLYCLNFVFEGIQSQQRKKKLRQNHLCYLKKKKQNKTEIILN